MFRPYNFKSIAAWTVGSLAGNYAYYKTKAASQGITISSGLVTPTHSRPCPEYVKDLVEKVETIQNVISSFPEAVRKTEARQGLFDLTSIIQMNAYSAWLQANKDKIKADIQAAYQKSTAEGCVWPEKALTELQAHIDSMTEAALESVELFRGWLFDPARIPDSNGRQTVRNIMQEREQLCYVNEANYKLVDTNKDRFCIK